MRAVGTVRRIVSEIDGQLAAAGLARAAHRPDRCHECASGSLPRAIVEYDPRMNVNARWLPGLIATALCGAGVVLSAQQPTGRATAPRAGIDWPGFRGIDASGVADGRQVPTKFASASAAWRTRIPGLGNSSPVVWGDLLCITTAVGGRPDATLKTGLYGDIAPVEDNSVHDWRVICLDKHTGAMRWNQTVHKGVPAIKRHTKATHANSTLATDGTHLAAMFGSEGLHVYDLNGKHVWSKSFGAPPQNLWVADQ